MSYSVLKVSMWTQAASLALHAAIIMGGGLLFLHPAQFGMNNGQGGATGLATRQVLQAEVQLNEPKSSTTTQVADKNELSRDLSPIPDPEGETVNNAVPVSAVKPGFNSADLPVSPVTEYRPAQEQASIGSPGTLTAKMAASGNGGAKTSAQPAYLNNPPPVYPTMAREKGQQGRVMLRVTIDVNGQVSSLHVRQTSGYAVLDESALNAVKKWQFSPATIGGMKVEDTIDLPIVFSLKK